MKLKLLEYENTRLKAKLKKIEKKLIENEKDIAIELSKGSEFKRLEEEFKELIIYLAIILCVIMIFIAVIDSMRR